VATSCRAVSVSTYVGVSTLTCIPIVAQS
jgi:hypothetical protein